jgi:phosphohistidine phosphatase
MTALRLFLVRHAEAEPQGTAGDGSRRLTPEGRARFAAHARAVAWRVSIRSVVTSPLVRARETADLLAQTTGAPVVEEPALASGVSTGAEVLALARRLGPGVALVGHNPELADAIAHAAGRRVEVRPGSVAVIDADPAGFRLVALETP